MKKYVWILLIGLLWLPGICAAAEIPARTGNVTDQAGLLTADQAAQISREADASDYKLYVLTVDSLDREPSSDYASEAYDYWRLSSRDLLLLISSGDQQVELSFVNPGLQASFDSWSRGEGGGAGSAAIQHALDVYFIPYARNGDFAGGIQSLIGAVNSIGTGQGAGGSSAARAIPLGTTVAALLAAALLTVLAYVTVAGTRLRKQLSGQREQISGLLVRANRALESLKPFQGIVQGKTGEMAEGISSRLSDALVQLSALNTDNQGAMPAFWRLSSLKSAIGSLREKEAAFCSALENEEKQISVISEADRNVKQKINELKKDVPELGGMLQEAVKETGFALQEIGEDLKELSEETDKADQLELFDPVAAEQITGAAQEKQEQIEKDLQDLDIYRDKLSRFPERLSAARSQIAELIKRNSLQNMKVRPYDNLEQAAAQAQAMEAPLRGGDMDEVRKISSALDALMEDAVAMTERQARLRESNGKDLETIRGGWDMLRRRQSELQSRISEAGRRFDARHTASAEAALDEWSRRLGEAEGEVPQIEAWTGDERGEYEQAREALDRLLALQEEAGRRLGGAANGLAALDDRLNKVNAVFREGQSQIESAQMLLRSRGLSYRGGLQLSALPEYQELQSGLAAAPYNLDDLEASARSYSAQISSFVEEANRLIRQREEEERLAQLAMLREQQRRQGRPPGSPPFGGGLGGGGFGGGGGRGGGGRSSGGSSWGGGGKSGGGSKW
ncbi:TPM domain-containing protein [Paenibacillus rhizophilus]|uniref:TPM domain-containing protein n=1 Tax=Paenibacillus rhizophilus TaxID=1850366 RepID=UPI00163B22AD|nr:TPM domain-containing protein [Paenibacillus rhizophilus]